MTAIQSSDNSISQTPSNEQSPEKRLTNEHCHLLTLFEIITDSPLHFEEQIHRALLEGLAMLRLDLAIVSNIVDNNYFVLFSAPAEASLEKNQTFDLNTTYCALTVKNQDVFAIDHMNVSPFSGHPCYSAFGLESYIGVPILVEDRPYGTLNFSSTVRRLTHFSETDRNFVRLMGRWIGTCLTASIRDKELQNYRTELEVRVAERTSALRQTNKRLRDEITETKRVQETLLKQQSFLNTLVETIPIPVFYKDISGRYMGCNKAFEDFLDRPRAEIIGKTVFEMAPQDIAETYHKKDQELFDNPGTQQYEWKFQKGDEEERAVIFQKATYTDERGEIAGLVGSVFDISEKNKIDKQLIQAQKLQAIGTLSSGIAHDFNNILSAIMGYTELARMKLSDNSQVQADLDKVYIAGKRAVELVKQILTFSRQSDQTIQPVKVGLLIKEVLKLMKASLPATIEIRSSIGQEVTVLANPTRLHQVLMNLCTNAWHAMIAEGGTLEVTLESTTIAPHSLLPTAGLQPGPYMKLQVKDTGSGIPQQIIDRIFDPFFTTKVTGEGSGLGLSVVHGIVKDLGGEIHVTSKVGVGSVFEVLIPMETEASATTLLAREHTLPRGSENILFVDDEAPLADLGKRLLEELGYSVTGCTSSSEALAVFKENPDTFDLVITDETMPKITGTMLAAELHLLHPKLPIILCSGFISTMNKDHAATMGINAF